MYLSHNIVYSQTNQVHCNFEGTHKYYCVIPQSQILLSPSDMTSSLDKVEGILQALLQFCQRNSSRLEEKARQVGNSKRMW